MGFLVGLRSTLPPPARCPGSADAKAQRLQKSLVSTLEGSAAACKGHGHRLVSSLRPRSLHCPGTRHLWPNLKAYAERSTAKRQSGYDFDVEEELCLHIRACTCLDHLPQGSAPGRSWGRTGPPEPPLTPSALRTGTHPESGDATVPEEMGCLCHPRTPSPSIAAPLLWDGINSPLHTPEVWGYHSGMCGGLEGAGLGVQTGAVWALPEGRQILSPLNPVPLFLISVTPCLRPHHPNPPPLSLCVSVSLCASASLCLSLGLCISISLSLSPCLHVSVSPCLCVSVSVFVSLCLGLPPSLCVSVCLSVCLSICLFLSLSLPHLCPFYFPAVPPV